MKFPMIGTLALAGLAGCGGLDLGGVSEDASEIEILSEEEAAEAAEEEIDAENLEEELDELMKELEEDESGL